MPKIETATDPLNFVLSQATYEWAYRQLTVNGDNSPDLKRVILARDRRIPIPQDIINLYIQNQGATYTKAFFEARSAGGKTDGVVILFNQERVPVKLFPFKLSPPILIKD